MPILFLLLLVVPMVFNVNIVANLIGPPAMALMRILLGAPPGF